MLDLKIRLFRKNAIMPTRATAKAAGFDLYACLGDEVVWIDPGQMKAIQTGLNMRIPDNHEVQIRPRSGLAFKNQITVINSPGTIDADFDGEGPDFEVKVMLFNHSQTPFKVEQGMRIAQMVVNKLPEVRLVEDFEENTDRSSERTGGFGSTGTGTLK